MEKGMAIIEVNDTETKGFYIDQDALEFSRQNAKVNKRMSNAAKDQKTAERKIRREEAAKAKRKAYNVATFKYVFYRALVAAAFVAAMAEGLVSPYIVAPVAIICLATACLRLGKWIERMEKK